MNAVTEPASFLGDPPLTEEAAAYYDKDRADDGYVWNVTRVWCWRPDLFAAFGALRAVLMEKSQLADRDWAVLVTSTASQLGDAYCSLAWGVRLAKLVGDEVAAQVISGVGEPDVSPRERALAEWARKVVRDPNATTEADLARLRENGLGDREIFEATAFIALRLAFATVNDALGAAPDPELARSAPEAVRAAVDYGRPPVGATSAPT
jgi:uncharacterized peroxidase-related enzyme